VATRTDLAHLFVFRDAFYASRYRLSPGGEKAEDLTALRPRTGGSVYAKRLVYTAFGGRPEPTSAHCCVDLYT
jgi:hypothetical protein